MSGKKSNSAKKGTKFSAIRNSFLDDENADLYNPLKNLVDAATLLSGIDDDVVLSSNSSEDEELNVKELEEEEQNVQEVKEDEEWEEETDEEKEVENDENIDSRQMGPVNKIARFNCSSEKEKTGEHFTIKVGYGTALSKDTDDICGSEKGTSITRYSRLSHDCSHLIREKPISINSVRRMMDKILMKPPFNIEESELTETGMYQLTFTPRKVGNTNCVKLLELVKPITDMVDTVIIVGKTKEAWLKPHAPKRSSETISSSFSLRKQSSSTIVDADTAIANNELIINLYTGVKLCNSVYYSDMAKKLLSFTYNVR